MKTFETEKGNIPEGATHYRNECEDFKFSWVKYGVLGLMVDDEKLGWTPFKAGLFESCVKPIPQTKEAEWVNGLPPVGVECEYFHKPRNLWVKFIPLLIVDELESPNSIPAIYGEWYHPEDYMWEADLIDSPKDTEFRKPEAPEQKLEREELEAAYELYSEWAKVNGYPKLSQLEFNNTERDRASFLSIVRITNYKVKGE